MGGPLLDVGQVACWLGAAKHVLVVGEPGSGRTTAARAAAAEAGFTALRGTSLRLTRRPRLPLLMALRQELGDLAPGELLLVEDVQWADEQTRRALAEHDGPLLMTGLVGATAPGAEVAHLAPLADDEAARLLPPDVTDVTEALRRAGGNPRLLRGLVPAAPAAGAARRTLHAIWAAAAPPERRSALLLGAAGRPLPLPPDDLTEPVGELRRLRIGALGELACASAGPEDLARAHREVAALVPEAADRARHLLAAGDPPAAREAALAAVRADPSPSRTCADLLRIAEPLTPELADLLARSLWLAGELDELLQRFAAPTTPEQQRLVALAHVALGRAVPSPAPAGALARARLASGELVTDPGTGTADERLAQAGSALASGQRLPDLLEGDAEQRWQSAALRAVAAHLDGRCDPPAPRDDRWTSSTVLLDAALRAQAGGASGELVELLASALQVPRPPAWGVAALAVAQAELGNAAEAALALDTAAPTSALDVQLLALARAECELVTGRPRRALRVVEDTAFWPVPGAYADVLRGWALHTVGEAVPAGTGGGLPAAQAELHALRTGLAGDFTAAAEQWEGRCARRALHCRWAAAQQDVAGLRVLEQQAHDQGLLPLLARVRESLRRAGARPTRTGTRSAAGGPGLSPREREVLDLVRDGLTSAQAATRLGVAQSTVETQVAAAMRKLGARTRRQAVALYEQAPA